MRELKEGRDMVKQRRGQRIKEGKIKETRMCENGHLGERKLQKIGSLCLSLLTSRLELAAHTGPPATL